MKLMWLMCCGLVLMGCTTVHDLGGGRYLVPRSIEERSLFGTNMGWTRIEACDGYLDDKKWGTQYRNCLAMTEWTPFGSPGQGGQIVGAALQGAGLGALGALMPRSMNSATSSTIIQQAPAGKPGKH